MARWKPAPVIGGAYSDDAKAWSDQDTVNWIPVVAERGGTRTPTMLRDAPGLVVISDLGTNAPIRGTHNVEGLLLAVSGNKLFKIGVDGAGTEIGTIPGVERVSMAHNQITGGNEVAIANGQSGYVYNTVTETLTQITDDGFPGAISFDFCDGYIMGIEPGRRFGFHSQLAAAGDYNTLDRYEAEGSPDKLVGQIVTHREWWLFGERTIEPYVNTGAATGTFQRASGTVMQKGLASRWAVAQIDNSVMWLGSDDVVYRAEGYTPVRKSTHAIEQAIARCNTAQAFAFVFDDRGHQIFYLTFPDGQTWGYDAASGEWHRRQSYGLNRWRINTLTKWRGAWIAGDYTNGRLYQLDWNTSNEAGEVLERRRVTGVLSDNQNQVIVNGVALVFDTGAERSPSPIIPPITISGHVSGGVSGAAVFYQYTVTGGVLPRGGVTVISGALPGGLSISATGLVTGTQTTPGDYEWVLQVIDADGNQATHTDSCTVSRNYSEEVLFDGPLAYWKLDDLAGSPMVDSTGNGYDGEYLTTGVSHRVTSIRAGAVGAMQLTSFAGGGRMPNTGNVFSFPTGPFSIEAISQWVQSGEVFGDLLNNGAQGLDGDNSYRMIYRYGTAKSIPRVDFDDVGIVSDDADTSGVQHLLFTFDGTNTARLYINGVMVSENTSAAHNTGLEGNAYLRVGSGYSAYSSSYGLKATVSDIAIYDTELSAERALAHAHAAGLA